MKTKIEWATDVWNPITGCTKVSTGCQHCYAERISTRFWGARKFTDVQLHPDRLEEPYHWKKTRRAFVNSMSDLFHPAVPDQFIANVFTVMALNERHTFMVLTKRPERMRNFVNKFPTSDGPIQNIWLGVSVENQQTADERIPYLLQTRAAVRFVSCEPLLGPVDLESVPLPDAFLTMNGITGCLQPLLEKVTTEPDDYHTFIYFTRLDMKLDWVIAGCESGPSARPMKVEWAISLKNQCVEAGVPFFFKQAMISNNRITKMPILDGRMWDEYPQSLRGDRDGD